MVFEIIGCTHFYIQDRKPVEVLCPIEAAAHVAVVSEATGLRTTLERRMTVLEPASQLNLTVIFTGGSLYCIRATIPQGSGGLQVYANRSC
jgi:hypothetical protein